MRPAGMFAAEPLGTLGRQRLVAYNRVVLALAAAVTATLAPESVASFHPVVRVLVVAFCWYAVGVALISSATRCAMGVGFMACLLIDVVTVTLLLSLTHGLASPFFSLLLFLFVTVAITWSDCRYRWLTSGIIAASLALAAFTVGGLDLSVQDQHHVLMRGVFLGLSAWWLTRWQGHEEAREENQALLARWPANIADARTFGGALAGTLEHAATVMQVARVMLFWQRPGETSVTQAEYCGGRVRVRRSEVPDLTYLVARPLVDSDFFCGDLHVSRPWVMRTSSEGLSEWRGMPIESRLFRRPMIGSILSVRFVAPSCEARVMFIDPPLPTSDGLALAQSVAAQLASFLTWTATQRQSLDAETMQARRQIADDLHDGLLQALSGMGLALERLQPALARDPEALQRLDQIQDSLAEEQRLLRLLVLDPRPDRGGATDDGFDLKAELQRLLARLQTQYGVPLSIHAAIAWPSIPGDLARQWYLLVHEAVINALRHGQAEMIEVLLKPSVTEHRFVITVQYRGVGFDFRGRFDLGMLQARDWGPKSLTRRLLRLGGTMTIDSRADGATVELVVPFVDASPSDAEHARGWGMSGYSSSEPVEYGH